MQLEVLVAAAGRQHHSQGEDHIGEAREDYLFLFEHQNFLLVLFEGAFVLEFFFHVFQNKKRIEAHDS